MGKLALYRKYRSRDFDELLGQDHVSSTLDNALKQGNISHAYLFTGPRGIGKTSAARILAARVNRLKQGEGSIDIIEIDAASNNGVDEIRDLREKVHIAPNYHQYKVYIVDEVHMLSQAAFNALLKTLEEPPAHVIFILATTEPHKLPATIISRTQHFAFRPVAKDAIAGHVKAIAAKESVQIDDDAAGMIAELSQGSMRDALSLLDQISNSADKIDKQAVRLALGIADESEVRDLLTAVGKNNRKEVLQVYDRVVESGIAPGQLLDQLIGLLRRDLRGGGDSTVLLHELCAIPANSPYLEVMIESVLIKHTGNTEAKTASKNGRKAKDSKTETGKNTDAPAAAEDTSTQSRLSEPSSAEDDKSNQAAYKLDSTGWVKTLSVIKAKDNALYALLRSTEQMFDGDKVVIKCRFQFHYRRLEEARYRQTLAAALTSTLGRPIKVELESRNDHETGKIDKEEIMSEAAPPPAGVDQILSIFGGEVL